MARIPVTFERVAAAFEADVARVRSCESSGSEHSPESSADLTDLVISFMEKNERGEGEEAASDVNDNDDEKGEEDDRLEKYEWSDPEKREMLQCLLEGSSEVDEDEDDLDAKKRIWGEVELAYGLVGDKSTPKFKRRLMTQLRKRGLDAGLCKSKWEKNGRFPSGDFKYMDLNYGGKRYVVEVSLSAEFQIARPTNHYCSLLQVFPLIYVGKVEELKRIVSLMCSAIKGSMKSMDLHVPPWRTNRYMQAKWFSSYKRTTSQVSIRKALSSDLSPQSKFSGTRSIGFVGRPVGLYNPVGLCEENISRSNPVARNGL